ncbi:hypothetical protein RBB50_003241 [Rhinocladiella similis]
MASLHETIVTPRTQPDAYQQPVWFASGRAPVQLHVQLSLNNHAQCCTITKSLFDKIHGNRPDLPFKDDGHLCKHNKQIRRVRLDVDVYGHAQSAFVTFCVLEGTESLVVMTGREGCWAETSKAVCIVVKEKRKSKDAAELKRRNEEDEQRFASMESTERATERAERAARRKAASRAANAQNASTAQDNAAQQAAK